MKMSRNDTDTDVFAELPSLFFETRQIIRQKLPSDKQSDPNAWMHLQTMHFIDRSTEPTMQDVATYLRIKAPSATSLVAHLVSQGVITRTTGADRRRVVLSITPAGKRALKKYSEESEKMMRSAFSTLDRKEVCSLCDILKKMISGNKKPKTATY